MNKQKQYEEQQVAAARAAMPAGFEQITEDHLKAGDLVWNTTNQNFDTVRQENSSVHAKQTWFVARAAKAEVTA